jgi:DNA-binding MarR family transcriptional regulator
MLSVLDQFTDDGIIVEKAIGFWINRVYQSTRAEMYRLFAEQGEEVTPEQWMVLIRLWEKDAVSQSELSDATLRDAPTMSRILRGMEARGIVQRRRSAEDARVQIVQLTRRGRALKDKLVPVARALVARVVRGIDEKDIAVTRSTLARMFENMQQ